MDYPGRGDDGSAACDPAMLQDRETGTIWMIFNHTPAGIGLWNSEQGIGFDQSGNRLLYDGEGREFKLGKGGYVFDSKGKKTKYIVDKKGDVYLDNEVIGNIYLKKAPF